MKRILSIVFWTLMIAGLGSLFVFANLRQKQLVCPKFEISMVYDNSNVLISDDYIRQQLTANGIRIKGKPLGSVDALKIASVLQHNPYIRRSGVTVDVNGVVKATIEQRNPIVRVITEDGKNYYIDDEGMLMPTMPENPVRVVMASGKTGILAGFLKSSDFIPKKNKKQVLTPELCNIYAAAMALERNAFAKALTEQIYLGNSGDIELIPKFGTHAIVLGDTSFVDEKLRNLRAFYDRSSVYNSLGVYKNINLRFRNQIVCTKID